MLNSAPKLCFFVNADWYFELHWLERAKAALAEGYSVCLVCGKTSDKVIEELKSHGIECYPISMRRGTLNPLSALMGIIHSFRVLRLVNADLVVCITLLPSLYGGLFAKFYKCKIVYSITGTGWIFSSFSTLSNFLRYLIITAFRFFSHNPQSFIIFENSDDHNLFLRNGMCTLSSSKVISGAGIDTQIFSPATSPDSINRNFTFLFAARLLNSKGLDTLIAAGKLLHATGVEFSIIVCGLYDSNSMDSISENQIEKWCQLPFVSWLGQRSDMPFIFSQTDVAVLPTRYGEGVPRFLIEAASCGLPCITTDVSGCRDIVLEDETGYLVQPGDSHALADKMLTLMSNSELVVNFGRRAREHVVQNFNQDLVISQTLSVYKSLLR